MGHRRGRPCKPKKKVTCLKCGWTGRRGTIGKKCPRCGFWYPRLDYSQFKVLDE